MLYDPRYQVLRQALVDARVKAGLTQVALAEQLRCAQSYVSKIETGGRYMDILGFLTWCEVTSADPCHILRQVQSVVGITPWPQFPAPV